MSGTPKLFPFRAWLKPSKRTNGDALHPSPPSACRQAQERKAVLSRAAFCVTVAALFVRVELVGRLSDTHEANSGSVSLGAVSLTASRVGDGLSVRFGLSNR
jgi:hypothetical protein